MVVVTVEAMGRPADVAGWKRQWRRIQERVVVSNSEWPLGRVMSTAVGRPCGETEMRTPTLPVMRRFRMAEGYGGRGAATDLQLTIDDLQFEEVAAGRGSAADLQLTIDDLQF